MARIARKQREPKESKELKEPKKPAKWDIETATESFMSAIEKKYGETPLSLNEDIAETRIPSSSLCLDLIMGGGIPVGRWITLFGMESSGKSTVLYQMLKGCLIAGIRKKDAFDYESSLATNFFANIMGDSLENLLGKKDENDEWVIIPKVRHYMPEFGEKMFRIVAGKLKLLPDALDLKGNRYLKFSSELAKKLKLPASAVEFKKDNYLYVKDTGPPIKYVIMVDSFPEMLPEALYDNEENNPLAQQARMFSTYIPLIRPLLRRKGAVLIGVNHTRLKPMVQFGCLHGRTKIPFVDGRSFTIKDIVDKKIKGEIWSLNEKTREIEPKKITAWHNNGPVSVSSDWIKIISQCPRTGNGLAHIIVTPNHKVLTKEGWKQAKDITTKDKLVTKSMQYKLPNKYQGLYEDFELENREYKGLYVQVIKVETGSKRTLRNPNRYDISVADNKNYIAGNKFNGVIVHNSPEYSPCGEHLKLATDIRIRVSAISIPNAKGRIEEEYNLDNELERFAYTKLKTYKNKTFPNGKETILRICIEKAGHSGYGIDLVYDLFQYLRHTSQIYKRGDTVKLRLKGPWEETPLTWDDLKKLVHIPHDSELIEKLLNPNFPKNYKPSTEWEKGIKALEIAVKRKSIAMIKKVLDIRGACQKQIITREAFTLTTIIKNDEDE